MSKRMKLHVVMLDTWRTTIAVQYEGETMPYGRRLVAIDLTDEQVAALQPRCVGERSGDDVFEEIGNVWIEETKNDD